MYKLVTCMLFSIALRAHAETSRNLPKELVDNQDFFAKMEVIEDLSTLEVVSDEEIKLAEQPAPAAKNQEPRD